MKWFSWDDVVTGNRVCGDLGYLAAFREAGDRDKEAGPSNRDLQRKIRYSRTSHGDQRPDGIDLFEFDLIETEPVVNLRNQVYSYNRGAWHVFRIPGSEEDIYANAQDFDIANQIHEGMLTSIVHPYPPFADTKEFQWTAKGKRETSE